jgi:hypothetical protein
MEQLHISDYNQTFDGPPDIIVIGAQMAGTTLIGTLLADILHHVVESGGKSGTKNGNLGNKEPHFFDAHFTDANFSSYVFWFNRRKNKADKAVNSKILTYDGGPDYFEFSYVWSRMKALYSPASLKKKKYILVLREPVVRSIYAYHQSYRRCRKLKPWNRDELCSGDLGKQYIQYCTYAYSSK